MDDELAERYSLGEDARVFLHEQLNTWGELLPSKGEGRQIDVMSGKVYAFSPPNLTPDELTIEALSRITNERAYDRVAGLHTLLKMHLQQNDAVFVVPEFFSTYKEMLAWKNVRYTLLLGCSNKAFHTWTCPIDVEDELKWLLRATEDWHYRGFLTYSAALRGRTGHQEVPVRTLRDLAARTRAIIFGAFDGEGHIIWER